jgi:5-methylcytosine-specific restriction endonuclease McrA
MAWIESHQSLRDHPKTRKLSHILGTSLPATIGHLQCLWWWAIDYAEDGNLSRFDTTDIAIGGEWDQNAETFVDALVTVGFLNYAAEGLTVHDWDDYAGKLIERRKAKVRRDLAARHRFRMVIIERDGYVCGICGGDVDLDDVDIDHITPVNHGGPSTPENLRVTHSSCNRRRGNRV